MNKNPSILIVGRQNVGKSTLFNLLIRFKKSIIDPTPGVTRDLVFGEINWEGKKLNIVDSGGISDESDETNLQVQKKTLNAQKDADLILFVVEAGNPLPIEEEYVNIVRKSGKKVILAMNKSDTPKKDGFVNDYFNFGLGEAIPISAAHNRNIDILMEKIFSEINYDSKKNNDEDEDEDEEKIIKIAILGKPNVGKSSLLNCIVGKERSIVSPIPGTTRDIIDEKFIFENNNFTILDTAGIRKKSKVVENVEYYSVNRAIKSIDLADLVFLVIDSMEDVSDQDKKIASQIIKKGKGLIFVLNKWDLNKINNTSIKEKKEMLFYKFPVLNYAPVINTSAKTGEGIKSLIKTSLKVYDELHKRIDTSMLNRFVEDIVKEYPPSSKKGILKIYYCTQIETAPVKFMIFVNKLSLINSNYQKYIINKLRESFGYSGIPIEILFKDKKNNKLIV